MIPFQRLKIVIAALNNEATSFFFGCDASFAGIFLSALHNQAGRAAFLLIS